jgi:hypothetical protein
MTNDNLQKIIDIVHKLQEEVPVNNVSSGQIAGTVEAGDSPPVRKKRPPIMARGKLPGARKRFKQGADFITNLRKNKYT